MARLMKIDKINIELVNNKIRLRWTFKGQRFSFSIGDNSQQNLEIAKSKAYQINSDIGLERFNPDDYQSRKDTAPRPQIKSEIRLIDLWEMFLKDKIKSGLKETSIDVYLRIDRLILKLGNNLSYDAFEVKERLEKFTTIGEVNLVLHKLSACCEYGIKRKLIKENSFNGVWEYLPDTPLKNPYCFNDKEIGQILTSFLNHPDHNRYYDLVVFLLNTGCRPSEALGVKWCDLDDDFTMITFRGSPQKINGKGIRWSEGSKNYKKGGRKPKTRVIPLNKTLRSSLEQRSARLTAYSEDLIFPNTANKFIHYTNFSGAWRSRVQSLHGFSDRIIYNCRD
ncbi:MAG TPA: tyrosine-type recombinase/integrase, partial [Allocoleopsis sp.]